MRAARRAGSKDAATETETSKRMIDERTSGSCGLVPVNTEYKRPFRIGDRTRGIRAAPGGAHKFQEQPARLLLHCLAQCSRKSVEARISPRRSTLFPPLIHLSFHRVIADRAASI